MHRGPIDETAALRFAAQIKVLGNRHERQQVEFLINGNEPCALPFTRRVGRLEHCAVERRFAPVRAQSTRKNFQQRRFAGAVFAQQRVHFSLAHLQLHAVQCLDAGKLLANVANIQKVGQGLAPLANFANALGLIDVGLRDEQRRDAGARAWECDAGPAPPVAEARFAPD